MLKPAEHLITVHRDSERMPDRARFTRLDRNERTTPFSAEVFRAMLTSLSPELFCSYPDPSPLYERLSQTWGLPEECLYLTNGSDASIRMTFQTYVIPGDLVVFPEPTYAMYAVYARIFQARAQTVGYSPALTLEVPRILKLLDEGPRLLVLANPDQPTGAVLHAEEIEHLAVTARKAGTILLIDEAYYPFYPYTAMELVRGLDNVVVTRSFSKVYGLAGLRLGVLVACPDIVRNIQRVRGAHEVNAVAIAMGSYVLNHPEISKAYLSEIEAGRKILVDGAVSLGITVPTCRTNFQLLQFPSLEHTADVVALLKSHGYLVKGEFASQELRNCIRVTLGGPELMRAFVAALRQVVPRLKQY